MRKKGWLLPREIPQKAWETFRMPVKMGFDVRLAK